MGLRPRNAATSSSLRFEDFAASRGRIDLREKNDCEKENVTKGKPVSHNLNQLFTGNANGATSLLHEVAAVRQIADLGAFPHHLHHAADPVMLGAILCAHFSSYFFQGCAAI